MIQGGVCVAGKASYVDVYRACHKMLMGEELQFANPSWRVYHHHQFLGVEAIPKGG